MPNNAPLKLRRFQRTERALTLKRSHRTKKHPTRPLCPKQSPHIRSIKLRRSQRDVQTCPSVEGAQSPSDAITVASASAPTPSAFESTPKMCMIVKRSQQGPLERAALLLWIEFKAFRGKNLWDSWVLGDTIGGRVSYRV